MNNCQKKCKNKRIIKINNISKKKNDKKMNSDKYRKK